MAFHAILHDHKPLALDHGYALTVHSIQCQAVDRILIDADTQSLTSNESAYYVAISRAKDEATIYADDKAMLPEVMARGDTKAAALDLDLER